MKKTFNRGFALLLALLIAAGALMFIPAVPAYAEGESGEMIPKNGITTIDELIVRVA